MPGEPALSPSGSDCDPVPSPDWMTEEDWIAWCAASADEEPPEFEDEFIDPAEAGAAARRGPG